MQTNRVTVFIVCLFYLVGLCFLLDAMSETITLNYNTTSQSIGSTFSFLGFNFTLGENFLGNVVVSITNMPIWINALFIGIPFVLMVVFGIMMWIPTIPSG